MNRRDTIIIATLVNMALLAVLFTTAKQSQRSHEVVLPTLPSKLAEIAHVEKVIERAPEKVITPAVLETAKPISRSELAAQFMDNEVKPKPVPVIEPTPQPEPVAPVEAPKEKVIQQQKVEQPGYTTVIVKKGDFLERIARANHTTVAVLMQLNDLSTTQLKIGQVIKVPVSQKQEDQKTQVKVANPDDYYVVKEGDSPWAIALRNGIRLEDLLQLNGLDESKARKLRPGDRLRIR